MNNPLYQPTGRQQLCRVYTNTDRQQAVYTPTDRQQLYRMYTHTDRQQLYIYTHRSTAVLQGVYEYRSAVAVYTPADRHQLFICISISSPVEGGGKIKCFQFKKGNVNNIINFLQRLKRMEDCRILKKMHGCITHKGMCFTRLIVASRTSLGGGTDRQDPDLANLNSLWGRQETVNL